MTSHDLQICIAIVCIAALGITYIVMGGDGIALSSTVAAISFILGYKFGTPPPTISQ